MSFLILLGTVDWFRMDSHPYRRHKAIAEIAFQLQPTPGAGTGVWVTRPLRATTKTATSERVQKKGLDILQDLRSAAHPNVAVDPE